MSLFKKFFSVFNININIWLLRFLLVILTAILLVSACGSSVVALQLNYLILGNFSSVDLKLFILFTFIAGIAFTCFIFSLNYILMRNSKSEERFIKPVHLILLFVIYIFLVYATIYLSIAFFYVFVYGMFMPPEVYYLFNNNAVHLKEFQLIHIQAHVMGIFFVLITVLTYTLYSLYCAYRIKKYFFDYEIFEKIDHFWEIKKSKGVKEFNNEFKYQKLIGKIFNYKTAEIYYRFFIYYYSVIWILEPLVIMFLYYRDTISHEFLTVKLTMDDSFVFTSLLVNFIFFFIPLYIYSNIKGIYGFKITDYLSKSLIDHGTDYYCKYLSIISSIWITYTITGIYYILDKYGGLVPTPNARTALSLTVILVTTYLFSKPRQILYAFIKPLMYEL